MNATLILIIVVALLCVALIVMFGIPIGRLALWRGRRRLANNPPRAIGW
jgi:hypothetical protein